ncbi:unnamed protein product, partial [Effrenium voratum]
MAPAVPSLRVQQLQELQRQQSIQLQQMLLKSPRSPRVERKTPRGNTAPSAVASPAPKGPAAVPSKPRPVRYSGSQKPVPQAEPSPKVQQLLAALDTLPELPQAFNSIKAARAGFLRLANEQCALRQRLWAQERLQEDLQTQIARQGGVRQRFEEERIRYDDHIQALSSAEKTQRLSSNAEARMAQCQAFADRLEKQAEDLRMSFAKVK